MPTSDSHADEVHRLRNTMRDLVAFSTLPAVWAGRDADGIARGFADILLNTLSLDLVYVRFRHPVSGSDTVAAVAKGRVVDAEQMSIVAGALAPWLTRDAPDPPSPVADPLGGADLHVAVARFGYVGDEGVVVACARRTDFPTEADRLLLGVGTNQTAVVLQRKFAEEDRFQLVAIVQSSDDAIVSKSLDGVIRSWNAGAERLFGYAAAEVVGRPIALIIPPERLGEEHDILARLRRGERIEHFETVRVAKGGRRLDISLTVSPVRDRDGRVIGASKVARDITERKRVDEALREADRKKDEFIALLAHELRNPLAPIRNGLQVIRLSEDRAVRERAQQMMERQLGHMVRLVDDLLDVSRINRNKMELRRSRVLLADVVSSAVETVRPAVDEAGHELTLSLPREPVALDADLTRLAQVFSNLLTNSTKYTGRGGHIWLSAVRRGDDVVVTVRDTGIGIPADALGNIFDMFSQVDRSVERSTGGLGIGLALVKGLVEMHGGTVTPASEGEGRGSTFTVILPVLVDRVVPTAEATDNGRAPAGPARRVLVVDDNRDGAESMAEMLRLLGNVVRTAHDGVEAVEEAERFRPEVVLMDVGMPRMSGLDATRQIRERSWGTGITIIALTGWGQGSDRERSREAGCDGHLVKPVSLADLERVLNESSPAPSR